MNVIIVEDEQGVLQNLIDVLKQVEPSVVILETFETISETVDWLKKGNTPDLGFFDIRIADGSSFEIFEKISVTFPVIFTTAYDEFALKAFKVNSVDYLMKPINKEELRNAINRYKSLFKKENITINQNELLKAIQTLKTNLKTYKEIFLVYVKDKILPIPVDSIAYFYLENEMVTCITYTNEKYNIEKSLDNIQSQLNPQIFFRANRQYLVSRKSIKSAAVYFNRKLKLEIEPKSPSEIIISKVKSSELKKWLTLTQ